MTLKAISLGSIGTLVESSDMQRRAYNHAIAEAGFDWDWTPDLYSELLKTPGGRKRVRNYAESVGDTITEEQVTAIHNDKSRIYQEMLREEGISLRPGIAELIKNAKADGLLLAWASGTNIGNLNAIVEATNDTLSFDMFDFYTHQEILTHRKPHPETFHIIMDKLSLTADEVLAIEDTESSLMSPVQAGVRVVATPGALTSNQDYAKATAVDSDGSKIADLDWLKSLMNIPAPVKE